jgi:hypothetical protein
VVPPVLCGYGGVAGQDGQVVQPGLQEEIQEGGGDEWACWEDDQMRALDGFGESMAVPGCEVKALIYLFSPLLSLHGEQFIPVGRDQGRVLK